MKNLRVKSIKTCCVVVLFSFCFSKSIAQEQFLNGEVKFQELDRSGVAVQNLQKAIAGLDEFKELSQQYINATVEMTNANADEDFFCPRRS